MDGESFTVEAGETDEVVEAIESGKIAEQPASAPAAGYISFGPFVMDGEGLTKNVKGKGGVLDTVVVCAPFEVLGVSRDPQGKSWGKQIRFRDADQQVHTHCVSDEALHGDAAALAGGLAHQGLRVDRGRQKDLAEYLNRVEPAGRITVVDRTGWHEVNGKPVFVMPAETIGANGLGERVVLETNGAGAYEARGDLAAWMASVGSLTAFHGLPILAVSAALAGPLAHLVGAEGGGVHFHGMSSIGKSAMLAAAASVWGRGGTPGYLRTWRSTANGLEGAAANATHTCLTLDEVGAGDAREVGASLYALANGMGKQRSRRDGSAREPRAWNVMLISSGELPVETKIEEDYGRKARAGQTVRLLDILADRGVGYGAFDNAGGFSDAGKLADAIKAAAITAYGTAGPEFIRRLMMHGLDPKSALERVGRLARQMIDRFVGAAPSSAGASEQVGRVARKFALIAAAGELAIMFKITPWARGDAEAAAILAFNRWIAARGGTGAHEESQAIAQVRLVIEQHGAARFEPLQAVQGVQGLTNIEPHPVHNRLGWRQGDGAQREWWVPSETWKREICLGLDAAEAARTLAKHGMLRRPKKGRDLTIRVRIDGSLTRVYVITEAIFA